MIHMSRPRLIYFDFAGSRGEECRIALHLVGIDFEDVRVRGCPTDAARTAPKLFADGHQRLGR
jgi:glutathione S-transferase